MNDKANNLEETWTWKCTPEVGALLRKHFARELKTYCFRYNLTLTLEEDKGFLSSRFLIKIVGPKKHLLSIQSWMKGLEG